MRLKFGIFWIFLITILLSSCLGTRYLEPGEQLLYKQKIKGNDEVSKEELEEFYRQQPNKRIPILPFAPYVWVYHMGLKKYDTAKIRSKITEIDKKFTAKINRQDSASRKAEKLKAKRDKKIQKKVQALEEGNVFMRWGEPLAIYDEEKARETNHQFQVYLKTKGYFNSSSTYSVNRSGRRTSIRYQIEENKPHVIDSFYFTSVDDTIQLILNDHMKDSHLEIGENYDQENLIQERARVELLLQNNGYFDFKKQYIEYRIDTLSEPFHADIEMVVNLPKRGYHKIFTVDSVIFTTDAGKRNPGNRQSKTYNKIKYKYYEKQFSKKILDQRVFIYPGQKYNKTGTINTQRQLANLDNFKFININYDTTGGLFIANIYTSSLKKYQMTNELGVNVTVGLPGPFYRFSLKNRNVFNGLENMELSGYYAFEGVASATGESGSVYSSTEAGAKLSFYFPQFLIPGFKNWKSKTGNLNPQSIFRTGFDFIDRPEYRRTGFSNSWLYNWRNYQKKINYTLTALEVSFINSNNITNDFQRYLDTLASQGNNLKNAFLPSFVSSSQFNVVFNFDPIDNFDNKASFLQVFGEVGGTTYNLFDPDKVFNNKEYYQFLKTSAEYIRHVPVTENGVIASRIKVGYAYPYGKNGALPYEKYYFSGGSNSVRAWRPRRLGPGSFNHNLAIESTDSDDLYGYSNKIEQPGEILIEANIEYRSKLVGFFDWAFFIDAGNIWLINKDITRPGGDFDLNRFYKEFGIGSGLGLRLNFSFLVVRFDYGVKIYDPIRPESERFIGDKFSILKFKGLKDQSLLNFAIGYPF